MLLSLKKRAHSSQSQALFHFFAVWHDALKKNQSDAARRIAALRVEKPPETSLVREQEVGVQWRPLEGLDAKGEIFMTVSGSVVHKVTKR
jgi:hypothetical protein